MINVPALLNYINNNQKHTVDAKTTLDIYEGDLLKYVLASMQLEFTERAFKRTRERVPAINVFQQYVDKVSKIYERPPRRSAVEENPIDEDLISIYEKHYDINSAMQLANKLLTIHKSVALEPFISEGVPYLRVLSADKFIAYSDDPVHPEKMTHFIKKMGSNPKTVMEGKRSYEKEVAIYHIYSKDSFYEIDSDGEILNQLDNDLGVIPFVYITSDSLNLVPKQDSDNKEISILIPKLLADLAYSIKYQSHSIMYGIDVEIDDLDGNPDSFWQVSSKEGDNAKPSLGTITPNADIQAVLSYIESVIAMWLSSKGLRPGSSGKMTVDQAASGVAKMIDSADVTAIRNSQVKIFSAAEKNLWQLTSILHEYWLLNDLLDPTVNDLRGFSSDFEVLLEYPEQKPIVDRKTVLEEIEKMFKMGLTNRRMALSFLFPEKTSFEIEELIEELESSLNSIDIDDILDNQDQEVEE